MEKILSILSVLSLFAAAIINEIYDLTKIQIYLIVIPYIIIFIVLIYRYLKKPTTELVYPPFKAFIKWLKNKKVK